MITRDITKEQAFRDPLRGNLYENLIIADIIKSAQSRGIRPEIYFFRDSHGNEVDLLIREKGEIFPVEIKSAATFSTSFVKGLEMFRALKATPQLLEQFCIMASRNSVFVVSGFSTRSLPTTSGGH